MSLKYEGRELYGADAHHEVPAWRLFERDFAGRTSAGDTTPRTFAGGLCILVRGERRRGYVVHGGCHGLPHLRIAGGARPPVGVQGRRRPSITSHSYFFEVIVARLSEKAQPCFSWARLFLPIRKPGYLCSARSATHVLRRQARAPRSCQCWCEEDGTCDSQVPLWGRGRC